MLDNTKVLFFTVISFLSSPLKQIFKLVIVVVNSLSSHGEVLYNGVHGTESAASLLLPELSSRREGRESCVSCKVVLVP